MEGYHVYYQTRDDSYYESINYLVQLASILCWKKHYGNINLFCNKKYLDSISKYGLDKEYDTINTDLLETMPFKDQQSKYWSFCKIYTAFEIAKHGAPFCIIDTDLIIRQPKMLNNTSDVLFFHREAFDINYEKNLYPCHTNWIDDDSLNWNINPMNCAILLFNSNFQELINIWYDTVVNIINSETAPEFVDNTVNTMFIEQRLLPVIIDKLKLTSEPILSNVYQSNLSKVDDGSEWEPRLINSFESIVIVDSIKHIWGVKESYADLIIRTNVIELAIETFEMLDVNSTNTFENILNEINKIE